MSNLDIRSVVFTVFQDVCREQGAECEQPVDDSIVLLESGLDSLGFAILVAELETRLGYDPFVLMDTPVYPRTMAEFIAMYESFAEHARPNV